VLTCVIIIREQISTSLRLPETIVNAMRKIYMGRMKRIMSWCCRRFSITIYLEVVQIVEASYQGQDNA
jgi:hypothetical protein